MRQTSLLLRKLWHKIGGNLSKIHVKDRFFHHTSRCLPYSNNEKAISSLASLALKATTMKSLTLQNEYLRAPSDTQFACLWHTRANIHPFQVCPLHGVNPLNLVVRGVFHPLKLCTVRQLEKV